MYRKGPFCIREFVLPFPVSQFFSSDSALVENLEYIFCFPERILKDCGVDCGMFYFLCSCM